MPYVSQTAPARAGKRTPVWGPAGSPRTLHQNPGPFQGRFCRRGTAPSAPATPNSKICQEKNVFYLPNSIFHPPPPPGLSAKPQKILVCDLCGVFFFRPIRRSQNEPKRTKSSQKLAKTEQKYLKTIHNGPLARFWCTLVYFSFWMCILG